MPKSDVRAALEALELFERTSPEVVERLTTIARPFSLEAGEYLFREGDPGDQTFLLASGSLDAIMRLPGRRELEITAVGEGGLIGEMAMLASRPRRFSVRASRASAGWTFAAADIGQFSAQHVPDFVRRLGRLALERLRDQYSRLDRLCSEDPRTEGSSRPTEQDDDRPVTAVEAEPEETAYLETVLFFSRFSASELEGLFGGLRRLAVPRGASVVPSSEDGPALLVVLRGAVETSIRRGGLAARARLAGPGRIVGHLNLLREGNESTPIVSRARERSILLEIPVEQVASIIDRGDDASRRFGWAVYADVVDALFESQRPIARMAASKIELGQA